MPRGSARAKRLLSLHRAVRAALPAEGGAQARPPAPALSSGGASPGAWSRSRAADQASGGTGRHRAAPGGTAQPGPARPHRAPPGPSRPPPARPPPVASRCSRLGEGATKRKRGGPVAVTSARGPSAPPGREGGGQEAGPGPRGTPHGGQSPGRPLSPRCPPRGSHLKQSACQSAFSACRYCPS